MVGWPKFIPQHGLDALKTYKYNAEDHSILTKLFLKRFWDWVVTLFPLWVAYVVPLFRAWIFPPIPRVYLQLVLVYTKEFIARVFLADYHAMVANQDQDRLSIVLTLVSASSHCSALYASYIGQPESGTRLTSLHRCYASTMLPFAGVTGHKTICRCGLVFPWPLSSF